MRCCCSLMNFFFTWERQINLNSKIFTVAIQLRWKWYWLDRPLCKNCCKFFVLVYFSIWEVVRFLIVLSGTFWRIHGLFFYFRFLSLLAFSHQERWAFSILKRAQLTCYCNSSNILSFVFLGNNYMLLTNNKLEGRIVDLFMNAIVD